MKNLIWIDLEMTGLNPAKDCIIEAAVAVTDDILENIYKGPELVISQPESALSAMDDWNKNCHTKSGLLDLVKTSKLSVQEAESQILNFVKQYCKKNESPLCGNSIYQDRAFIRKYMPELEDFLHYRIIDVSSVKELVYRWYPKNPKARYIKKEVHRAMPDVIESINELKHYRRNFFV